jgi:predicted hydrolase (HD superfamily)
LVKKHVKNKNLIKHAIDAQFVLNRFAEKHFARGADREQIKACSLLGLTLEEFIGISLEAMQSASGELGL